MSTIINTVRPFKNGKLPKVANLIKANFQGILAEKMSIHLPDIVDAQISLAKGFSHTTVDSNGQIHEKKELPDTQAAKLLFEYTLEKPKQEVHHSGTLGIVALVAQLENGDTEET